MTHIQFEASEVGRIKKPNVNVIIAVKALFHQLVPKGLPHNDGYRVPVPSLSLFESEGSGSHLGSYEEP